MLLSNIVQKQPQPGKPNRGLGGLENVKKAMLYNDDQMIRNAWQKTDYPWDFWLNLNG